MAAWNTNRIGWKADLAEACVDSVTGRLIRDASLQVWAPHRPRPVRKAEGYYVFVGCQPGPMEVHITSPFFQESLFPAEVSGGFAVKVVRLAPGRRYPFPAGTAFLTGKAVPGSQVQAVGGTPLRLGEDAAQGDQVLRLHGVEHLRWDGGLFALTAKGETAPGGYLRLEEPLEDDPGCYRLQSPLERALPMAQFSLTPVWETAAGEDGSYWLAVPGGAGAAAVCRCLAPGDEPRKRELLLGPGENELDF